MKNGADIIIYTDGGCRGNPGRGGWGCVIIDGEKEHKVSGGELFSTNNRMELLAAINALSAVAKNENWKNRPVKVFLDSQYVKNGITDWIARWKVNGWKNSAKKAILNKDLWLRLDDLSTTLNVEWNWIKGHAGIKYNEICDSLCNMEIDKQINQ